MSALAEYSLIPIAFEVRAVFDVVAEEADGTRFNLTEQHVASPYSKDYDALSGEGPLQWAGRFDVSNWGLIAARVDGQYVGGVAVAYDTPDLEMLEGRSDLAMLWDIRVLPGMRRRGVGRALFQAVEAWACVRGCRLLKVETQNINVAACRFYARQGFVLRTVHRGAYPDFPDEIQLLWYKNLAHETSAG
jgi:GNAT superfamily N-acetyltransferase